MKNNGKNNFYRLLNLDQESKLALKWFRTHVKSILDNADKRQTIPINDEESK